MCSLLQTSDQLIARVRDCGDVSAWSQFIRIYEPLVMGICRKRSLQPADAADVTQEVFAAIAKAMPGFRYDSARGTFRSWLTKVTRSKLANYFEKRVKRVEGLDSVAVALHEQRNERPKIERDESVAQRWSLCDRVAAELRQQFRRTTWNAFWLTVMQEFTAEEVANRLDISIQAVYIAKSRVLKRFRQRVRELATQSCR